MKTGAAMEAIARQAGAYCLNEMKKIGRDDVEVKSKASLVSYVDKQSERMIVETLRRLFPGAGFVTEEGTAGNRGEPLIWYVDPLDGTTNYLHGLFPFSVSIALAEEGEIVAGVVYEAGRDELFSAVKGGTALLNGMPVRVSDCVRSEEALVATGFPYYDFERVDSYLAAMEELMMGTRGLRRMGSAAADLAWVAAGRFTAFFEHALHAWDVAAGAFLVQQAGGKVSDFNGGGNWLSGGEMVAAGARYYPEFLSLIRRHLGTP